jgi:cation diffusion facilitator family transporter
VTSSSTLAPPPAAPAAWRTRPADVRRALALILVLNAVVVGVKMVVAVRTGSLSVWGATLESGLDALNNVIGMALVTVAARAPDEDHPYGHDKFETLGALAIVGFLSISCFELLRAGIMQLIRPETLRQPSRLELGLLVFTGVVNVFVVWYERRRGRELNSAFLLADAAHTSSDLFVTALATTSLVLVRVGLHGWDAPLSILVALLIAWNGWQILRATIPILVDERGVDAGEIRRLVGAIPRIADVRDVRSRSTASGVLFAEVTIGVAAGTSVETAHELADEVEQQIGRTLGDSRVTVHVEPV